MAAARTGSGNRVTLAGMTYTRTVLWTLHQSTPERTIIGTAACRAVAHHDLLAATRAAIAAAAPDTQPRYTLHLDRTLLAIIATGVDEHGVPDHALAAHHAGQLDQQRDPYQP